MPRQPHASIDTDTSDAWWVPLLTGTTQQSRKEFRKRKYGICTTNEQGTEEEVRSKPPVSNKVDEPMEIVPAKVQKAGPVVDIVPCKKDSLQAQETVLPQTKLKPDVKAWLRSMGE